MAGERLDLVSGGEDEAERSQRRTPPDLRSEPTRSSANVANGNELTRSASVPSSASVSSRLPPSHPYSSGMDGRQGEQAAAKKSGEPFLGMQFNCCRIYTRIYRNRDKTAYEGRCPRCARKVIVPIGSGGSGARFFEVG